MRVLITILIIVLIFCVLVYDSQIKETFAQEETNIYNKHPETLNLSNFTSYFLPQQYESSHDSYPQIYEKIKGGIIDLYFKFFSKFYYENSYLFTEVDDDSSKNILISNLAIVKEFGKLKGETKNVTALGDKTLEFLIKEPLEQVLKNYVVIYENPYFYESYDDNNFYIADTKGNFLFSYTGDDKEEIIFPDTILEKLKTRISTIFSNPKANKYKFIILNKNLEERFKLNFEINFGPPKKKIMYSWNIEKINFDKDTTLNYNNIYQEIRRKILQLYMEDEDSMMGALENNKDITYTKKSILKNNLSFFKNLCLQMQNENPYGAMVDCYSNFGCLETIFKYFTNYNSIKNKIDTDDPKFKIKNFSNMEIEDYYLIISFYQNFYYDRYNQNSHQKIIKLIIYIFNEIEKNNSTTDLLSEGSNNVVSSADSMNNLVLKLNYDSLEILKQYINEENIPNLFKTKIREKIRILNEDETKALFTEDITETQTANNVEEVDNSMDFNYQRNSFKIKLRVGELEPIEQAGEKIDKALEALTKATQDGPE